MAITFDSWTSVTNHNYIAVTGHFLHNLKLQTCLLSFIEVSASHSAADIANSITDDFKTNYGFLPVTCCVTDNAPNMPLTAEKMEINHVPCFLHTLQLVVKHAILKNSKISAELNDNDVFDILRLVPWWYGDGGIKNYDLLEFNCLY